MGSSVLSGTKRGVLAVAVCCTVVAGCSMQPPGGASAPEEQSAAPDGKPVIGVSAIDLTSPFFVGMRQGADRAAKEYGVTTTWQSAENSVEKQVTTIQNFINQDVDAIMIDPLDKNALAPVIRRADRAGISVVSMGNKVNAKGAHNTLYRDAESMRTVARAAATSMGGTGRMALLTGARGNYVSDVREDAFTRTIGDDFPGIDLVPTQPTAFDARQASNATVTWLTTYSDLDMVVCISDPLCLSAKTTASSLGYPDVRIAGFDGESDMHPLLRDGSMVVDVLTGAQRVGYWNVAVGARLASGADLDGDLYLPSHFVSTDETAARLERRGMELDHVTPKEATAIARDYSDEFGPRRDDEEMSDARK